jgi:tripartite-type tricarboxylate transporter receptor subunit TctC
MISSLRAAALAAALVAAWSAGVAAQSWPTKPVRVVLGFASGGPTDTLARAVADHLGQVIGQPAVVENKPGAASNLAAEAVAKSLPDGHTLFVGGMGPFAVNSSLFASLPFDPARDFAPITLLARTPLMMAVNPALPANSLAEFIAYAKANPGKINHSSPGTGSSPHLAAEMFRGRAGFESTNASYRSGPLMLNAVVQGEVQWTIDAPITTMPQFRAGKVRVLAITSPMRSPHYPEIPTMAELGFPEVSVFAWFALAAPAGTPKDIVDRINAEVAASLKSEPVRQRLAALGFEPAPMSPAETAKYLAEERVRWGAVVRANNIRAE